MASRLDMIIFGATGFTGKHCISYIVDLSNKAGRNLTWGVAGRSTEKLKAVLKEEGEKIGSNLDSIPLIVADIKNTESLAEMAKKARLIINCCGPYRFYGDPVVSACIEQGTHHVDVSGEPEYMELLQINYHDAAMKKGVYVISACGLDSIPTDLGIVFLQQNFEGTLNSVETYLKAWSEKSVKGSLVNYGTWESAVYGVANAENVQKVHKMFSEKFKKPPSYPPKLHFRYLPHKTEVTEGWAVPFLGADRSVARRTQGYFYEYDNIRPVQVGTYVVFPSIAAVIVLFFYGFIFLLLTRFRFGRKLLLDYPQCFSAGYFSKKPPPEENIQNAWFSVDFYGEGWKEKLANKDDQYSTPIDKVITARVKGKNPGYGSTCLSLVLAGIVVLTETDKLPNNGKGGVYSPGAAFAKTSLVKQLNENGLTFEILSQKDIKSN